MQLQLIDTYLFIYIFCCLPEQNHCNYGFESLPECIVNPATSNGNACLRRHSCNGIIFYVCMKFTYIVRLHCVAEHVFNVFLKDHLETAFTKGFDDSVGRHVASNLFEVLNVN